MTSKSVERPRLTGLLTTVLVVQCLLIAACSLVRQRTPRHGWNEGWGPLVPHETFPADCSLCHVAERWDVLKEDFAFDHGKETGFPLQGAHARAACLRCHNDFGPVQEYVARGCQGCHSDVHRAQLGGDCLRCHNQESWRPQGMIAKHARTGFPLVGAHIAVACELCHTRAPTGDYRGAPTDCALCHKDDVQRATSPDHVAQGWVDRCERCHFPSTWGSGGFTHQFFPLTGGHAQLDCSLCHTDGTFGPLPRDCNSCHSDDYARAPDHVALNFPRQCQQCHTTTRWEGAVFRHTFPLRGPHNVDCSVCHVGGNTSTFSCLVCHEHRRSETDEEHDEVAGYVYQSSACLQCHPTGDN